MEAPSRYKLSEKKFIIIFSIFFPPETMEIDGKEARLQRKQATYISLVTYSLFFSSLNFSFMYL